MTTQSVPARLPDFAPAPEPGTRRIIDQQERVYYEGYWIKTYPVPGDCLAAKKNLIEALTRRLFNHTEHGLNVPGVRLQEARWHAGAAEVPASVADSPESHACRRAFAALVEAAAPLAAVGGNLERLSREYRRSVRRARALQDVLLPALERDVAEIETRLEELEQQDAIAMRRRAA